MNLILGDGLGLRMPNVTDRERWLEMIHDPEQLRFGVPSVIPVPETVEEIDGRVDETRRKYAAGEPTTFVIVMEHHPELFLGTVGYSFHVPAPLRVADVGYSVHPDSRGRGVATGALRTLTRWLVAGPDSPQVARVQLDHSVENPASCRVALAAGFEQEGIRRSFLPLRDPDAPQGARRHDVCLHGLVAQP